jgi:hypothetical protein
MTGLITKLVLAAGLMIGGAVASASAAPVSMGATAPAATANAIQDGAVTQIHHRRWHRQGYGARRAYRRPVYRSYRPAYRSGPRVVCRTRYQTVFRPGYGYIRRPVRVCQRRW